MLTTYAHGKTGTAPGTMTLTIPSSGMGAIPNDFDISRAHLNYLAWYSGWVPGQLGQSSMPASPEAAMAELEVYRAKLAAEQAVADLQHTKASSTWLVVGGLVGIAGLIVSIIHLTRSS